jgi:hypothetical protein
MSQQANIKYAYLVFNSPFPFPRDVDFFFDERTHLHSGSLEDHINRPGWDHWSKWLGSLVWDSLANTDKIILSTWQESNTADVIDQENTALESELRNIFRLLPLVAPFAPPTGEIFLFSGKGSIVDEELSADSVRTFSRVLPWTRGYYDDRQWKTYSDWSHPILRLNDRFKDWKVCVDHVNQHVIGSASKRQMVEAYRSFDEALRGSQLEFKIPNLVRAVECLVDCWGAQEFANRALFLTGPLPSELPFSVAQDTVARLKNLYQLRNDCSHGKPFAYSLEKSLGKFPDRETIASYEFLAEWVARKILNDSFINQSVLTASSDRDSLVAAWRNKVVTGADGALLGG